MFGIFNKEAEQRKIAVEYLKEALAQCQGSCDLGVVIGAADLAEKLGLINHKEYLLYHNEAYRLNKEYEQARKEASMRKAAERKAERAAKAKAAKE